MDLLSVILFCASAAAVFGNTIKSDKTDVGVAEGQNVKLSCSYSSTGVTEYLFWYRQNGRSMPEFLVSTHSAAKEPQVSDVDSRLSVEVTKKEQIHVDLEISSAEVSDSALYYCALQNDGTRKIIFGSGTTLFIEPQQKKDPDYYQLQGSCLATDFTNHSDVNYNSGSVRYSGKDYQNYFSSFAIGGGGDCPEGTDSCKGSSSQSGDIERDEKINFFSLGLFWLRILFLKTVVFNVLVTFKAWMS